MWFTKTTQLYERYELNSIHFRENRQLTRGYKPIVKKTGNQCPVDILIYTTLVTPWPENVSEPVFKAPAETGTRRIIPTSKEKNTDLGLTMNFMEMILFHI